MTSAGTITRRVVTAAAALALWLPAAPPMAAAQTNWLELIPTHGQPGSEVSVVPHIANSEFDCAADFPQEVGWDSKPFTCGQAKGSTAFGSTALWIPADAAAGPHQVRVQFSRSVVNFQDSSLFADFTVDQPPGESTTDPPTSDSETPTTSPTEPPATAPKPTAPDGSRATHGPGTPGATTTTTTAPAAGTTTDPPTGTGVVDLSRNLPLGFALLAAVLALAAAIAMPKLVRTLRRRTPRWVSQNLRVVIDPGIPRTVAPVTRSGPATTVRLAVRVDQPRKEGRS